MSVDLASLLGTARAVQVARADYDYTRDGGAVGPIALASEVIPSGSVVFGGAIYTTTAMTYSTTGAISVKIGPDTFGSPPATLGNVRAFVWYDVAAVVTDADRAIVAVVSNDVVTAGAFTAWVFYLPATD